MDMYQKRKMRAENKMNSSKEEKKNGAEFNWDIPPYGKIVCRTKEMI